MKIILLHCLLLLTSFIINEAYAEEINNAELTALKKLSISGVTKEIRTAAIDSLKIFEESNMDEYIEGYPGYPMLGEGRYQQLNETDKKNSIKKLTEAAKNAPNPYKSKSFLCLYDYNLCITNSKYTCTAALIVCFSEAVINEAGSN